MNRINIKKIIQDKNNYPLWILSFGHMLTHWYPATFYLVLPLIRQELGLSYTEVGFIITLRSVIGAIANVPGGIIVDLVRKKSNLVAISLIAVSVPYALMGLGGGYYVILVCVAFIGAGGHFWHSVSISELSDRYQDKLGWAIGIHHMAANLGDAMGPIVAGFFLSYLVWRQFVVINALPAILIAFAVWFLFTRNQSMDDSLQVKESLSARVSSYKENVKAYFKNRNVLLLLLLSGIRSFSQNSLMVFLPFYFMNVLSMTTVITGVFLGVIQMGGAVAAPLTGYFSDRLGRKKLISMGLTSTSVLIVVLALIRAEIVFIIMLSIFGFALFSLRTVILAWLMDITPPGFRGTSVGAQFGVQQLFNSIAPLVGGWIADSWGLINTFYFIAVSLLLANAVTYAVKE